jgi:hypothetical protein
MGVQLRTISSHRSGVYEKTVSRVEQVSYAEILCV